jgi:FkbM family methyltransferase
MKLDNMVLAFTAYVAKVLPLSVKSFLYRSPSISRLIRKGLNRYAPDYFSKVSIAAGANESLKMYLDMQREKDYWLGTYEFELQQAIEELSKPGQIIYDIGANVGFISLLFARRTGPNGHVYAFEALPENINRLRQNIEINGYQDRVSVIHAAVQDHSGQAEFLIGPSDAMGKVQGSAGRNTLEYKNMVQVEGISIDEFIENMGNPIPDVIKMDIEGGEVLALPGMEKLLRDGRPLLLIELHGNEAAQATWHALRPAGYRICRMETHFPQVNGVEDLDWKSYLVAFPNE